MAEVAALPLATLRGVVALERALCYAEDAADEELNSDDEEEDEPQPRAAVVAAAVPVAGVAAAQARAEPWFPQLCPRALSDSGRQAPLQGLQVLEAALRHVEGRYTL